MFKKPKSSSELRQEVARLAKLNESLRDCEADSYKRANDWEDKYDDCCRANKDYQYLVASQELKIKELEGLVSSMAIAASKKGCDKNE